MTNDIEARVARGVALLDEKLPGWDQRIDMDRLDLSNTCGCVLGQTWDEGPYDDDEPYFMHSARLFGRHDQARDAEHGFNVDPQHRGGPQTMRAIDAENAALTAEWRRVIEDRQGGAR